MPETKTYPISDSALSVLTKRYFKPDENWESLCLRVTKALAPNQLEVQKMYFKIMYDRDFLPNTPCLINAGTSIGQLMACFVLPVEDSIDGIFSSIKNAAIIHKSGGGTGFSFSRLRESNTRVQSTNGIASGPISFMEVFNAATGAIKQGGVRRGANMGMLRIDHPDIQSFIECKSDTKQLTNFNISVAITSKFMEAVQKDKPFDLISPFTNTVIKTVRAKELWDKIAHFAWLNGEPGIIFIDEVNKYNPTPLAGDMEATNPCGEQPLLPYEACVLGSINLAHVVEQENWQERLREITDIATCMLNSIIDYSTYPLPEIERMVKTNRKVGLGIMGWADMLMKLKIPYDSEMAIHLANEVMSTIYAESKHISGILAETTGIHAPSMSTLNATTTTIAPTGSISMIADCSSGIEPAFSLAYTKTVIDGTPYQYINQYLKAALEEVGLWTEKIEKEVLRSGSIQHIEEIPQDIKDVYKISHEISPTDHIKMQAAFQVWVDNAVSKTINLPKSATEDDVKNAYLFAYDNKCKGITVYRDGSRESQILSVGYKQKRKTCPECNGKIVHESGCVTCVECGWAVCE